MVPQAMNTAAMLAVQAVMKRLVALVSLAALLAGCAPMEWTRSDATPEQMAADMRACREQAWRETRWNYFNYYGATGPAVFADPFGRHYLWPYYGPFGDPFGDRFMEESRLANFCMRAKGYELAPVTK